MATDYCLVHTTPDHAQYVEDNLRPMDVKEFDILLSMTPRQGVSYSQAVASASYTAFYEGKPACIFGYTMINMVGGEGAPFLYGTDLLDKRPYVFAKYSTQGIAIYAGKHMANYVLEENRLARRWLKWLGFEVGEVQQYRGHGIRRFEKGAEECAYQWPSWQPQLQLAQLAR